VPLNADSEVTKALPSHTVARHWRVHCPDRPVLFHLHRLSVMPDGPSEHRLFQVARKSLSRDENDQSPIPDHYLHVLFRHLQKYPDEDKFLMDLQDGGRALVCLLCMTEIFVANDEDQLESFDAYWVSPDLTFTFIGTRPLYTSPGSHCLYWPPSPCLRGGPRHFLRQRHNRKPYGCGPRIYLGTSFQLIHPGSKHHPQEACHEDCRVVGWRYNRVFH
jgi:hypothetical protein